jgi:hypothetical protein
MTELQYLVLFMGAVGVGMGAGLLIFFTVYGISTAMDAVKAASGY